MTWASALYTRQVAPILQGCFPDSSRVFLQMHGSLSLCKHDMCAFFGYFLITPAETNIHQNLWKSSVKTPKSMVMFILSPLSSFVDI
jgi:hypothetical protein